MILNKKHSFLSLLSFSSLLSLLSPSSSATRPTTCTWSSLLTSPRPRVIRVVRGRLGNHFWGFVNALVLENNFHVEPMVTRKTHQALANLFPNTRSRFKVAEEEDIGFEHYHQLFLKEVDRSVLEYYSAKLGQKVSFNRTADNRLLIPAALHSKLPIEVNDLIDQPIFSQRLHAKLKAENVKWRIYNGPILGLDNLKSSPIHIYPGEMPSTRDLKDSEHLLPQLLHYFRLREDLLERAKVVLDKVAIQHRQRHFGDKTSTKNNEKKSKRKRNLSTCTRSNEKANNNANSQCNSTNKVEARNNYSGSKNKTSNNITGNDEADTNDNVINVENSAKSDKRNQDNLKSAKDTKKTKKKREKSKKPLVFVGVHARRTDHLEYEAKHKLKSLTPAYFIEAMDKFRRFFEDASTIFVFVSDDMHFGKERILPRIKERDLYLAGKGDASSADLDLAILSLCNHTISSHGTFSFLASFLAGGKTIIPEHFERFRAQKMIGLNEDPLLHPLPRLYFFEDYIKWNT